MDKNVHVMSCTRLSPFFLVCGGSLGTRFYPSLMPRPPTSASHEEKGREGLIAIITCRDVCTHRVDLYAHAMNQPAWQTRHGDY